MYMLNAIFRFVKCEKCSHFFVVLSDADAKNKTGREQMGMGGSPDLQNAQQGEQIGGPF